MEDSTHHHQQDRNVVAEGSKKNVSGPLDVRRLQGDARCSRCRDAQRDCYLERGDRSPAAAAAAATGICCLTCKDGDECRFRRVVVREDIAANFTWEELVRDGDGDGGLGLGVDVNSMIAVDVGGNGGGSVAGMSRKRPYAATMMEDESQNLLASHAYAQAQGQAGAPPIPSLVSEPASQIRTHVSYYNNINMPPPFWFDPNSVVGLQNVDDPNNDSTDNSMMMFNNDTLLVGMVDESLWGPYVPGQLPPDERQSSVSHGLEHAVYQLGEVDPSWSMNFAPQSHRPRVPSTSTPMSATLVPDGGLARTSATPVSDVQDTTPARFQCGVCQEMLNTRSEYKKHMARHQKPFTCKIPGCPRTTDGFATRNDLDRHEATVHNKSHGEKMYKCSDPACKDPNKVWRRKDNFKAHVKRMHPSEDVDAVVERSFIGEDTSENVT